MIRTSDISQFIDEKVLLNKYYTPLSFALENQYLQLTKLLIKHGADIDKPIETVYPLQIPLEKLSYDQDNTQYMQLTTLLIEAKADVNAVDKITKVFL